MAKSSKKLILSQSTVMIVVLLFIVTFISYSRRLVRVGIEKGQESAQVMGVSSEQLSNGVLEIRASNIEDAHMIDGIFEAQEGIRPVCVELEIKNISGSMQQFIPLEEIKLSDSTGTEYPIGGVLTCAPGIGGEIQVGQVSKGKLGFFIPKSSQDIKLHLTPLNNNTKSFIIYNLE